MNSKSMDICDKTTIETLRLIIIPLNYEQLIKYAKCDSSLEAELNLNKSSRTISNELKEALEQAIIPNVADQNKDYLYSTIWTAILKTENKMAGDICMYGEPDENDTVEIGYGTYDEFCNNGYMTEIVAGLVDWLKKQGRVERVRASTEKSNTASFRVLEKNGFIKIGEAGNLLTWELKV